MMYRSMYLFEIYMNLIGYPSRKVSYMRSSRAAGISGFIEPRTATPNPVIGRDVIETYYL